jgi:hypothetical protein
MDSQLIGYIFFLIRVFIQFNDAPRVSISGAEIKDFLLNHEDMSQVLESALIRVLRRDESHREPNSQGSTHYVGKEWAVIIPKQNQPNFTNIEYSPFSSSKLYHVHTPSI